MQDKKMKQKFVLLSVAADTLSEAGIDEGGILEIYAEKGRIIIQAADTENFVCGDDCESCPMSETDCDGECADCPCFEECDEAEVNENE